jgi:hypothetical protein
MTLRETVESLIKNLPAENPEFELSNALREAEKLADQFAEVKPVPYNIPMERFAGLPYFVKH